MWQERIKELSCGCRVDWSGRITHYGDYCLVAKAMEYLTEACWRAVEEEDGELAGIACQGLKPLLEVTAVGYGHEEISNGGYKEFGDIWNRANVALDMAWQVWKEKGAPHWVGSPPSDKPEI